MHPEGGCSQSKAASSSLHQTADELLRADDKVLSSLQKLGRELDPEDMEEEETVAEIRDMCMR